MTPIPTASNPTAASAGPALTSLDVREILRAACAEKGSQKLWADYAGVSQPYVADVLNGRREPGESILEPLGLERVVTYRRKA